MKIVLAPDSFKGCLRSPAVCAALAQGIREAAPEAEIVSVPMADGGEGTTESVAAAAGGALRTALVHDPLGRPHKALFAQLTDGTAVAEMASASGIEILSKEELNPLTCSTFGTGELIKAMLESGAKRIVLGIGGSATVDGGAGMAQALGYRLLDSGGRELTPGGGALGGLRHIDASTAHPRLRECCIQVACDVTNPLLGEHGAVAIFAPQKGATPQMMPTLEAGLSRLYETWKSQGMLVSEEPGDGAAGGLGAGLRAFCDAELVSGARLVADVVGLQQALSGADLVITGEGCSDRSTAYGKLPAVVAQIATTKGIPTILVSGGIRDSEALGGVFAATFSVCQNVMSLEEALESAKENLRLTARNLVQLWLCARTPA